MWKMVRILSTSAIFVWRALRNFALADFEENIKEMVGTTREAADGDRARRGRDGDETSCPGGSGDETGDKTAATADDERDGGDRGVMYTDEGELEFDEDEMAALEGQRLVVEFRCRIY